MIPESSISQTKKRLMMKQKASLQSYLTFSIIRDIINTERVILPLYHLRYERKG